MSQDPATIIELIEAFRRSKTMFTAVAMGIFDLLVNRPARAQDLASELHVNEGGLCRLLDGCVGLGLLTQDNGVYSNSELATVYLCRSSPRSLAGYIRYSDSALYPLWGKLEEAVREGSPRWQQVFGSEGPIFAHFFRTDEAMRDFLAGMHGFGLLSSESVVNSFDLSRFRRLLDLGGATGHLAIAACRRYPELRAVVFDLTPVIRIAQDHVAGIPESGRIDLVSGDFFSDPLPDADLCALGRILHDWSEYKIRRLLEKIHRALPAGGGLLIAEKLIDKDKSGPVSALMQSLNMLVCTEGKERTLEEYSLLLNETGFTEVRANQTGRPIDAIFALKA
jgi:acetylserotonin N-methyltransferase